MLIQLKASDYSSTELISIFSSLQQMHSSPQPPGASSKLSSLSPVPNHTVSRQTPSLSSTAASACPKALVGAEIGVAVR